MTAYDALMAHERETQALAQVAGRLSWDQETVMPRGASILIPEKTPVIALVKAWR